MGETTRRTSWLGSARRGGRLWCLTICLGLGGLATGCSGADPAEVSEVVNHYSGSSNPLAVPLQKEQATCRAEVYLESDLSESALEDVRQAKTPRPRNDKDGEILRELAGELAECL